MKKLFVLLLALTVAGIAFAQDAAPAPALVLSGYLNTGFIYSQGGGTSNSIALNADDAGKSDRFNVAGKYDAGDYGVYFRIREQNAFNAAKPAEFLNRAYGWFTVFNKMVTLQAGKLGASRYATAQDENFGDWDTNPGFELAVTPVEGFTFGGMLPVGINEAGAVAVADASPDNPPAAAVAAANSDSANNTFKKLWFGAKYSAKGLVDVSGGYHMSTNSKAGMAFAYVGLTAVPNLTAYTEIQLKNVGAKVADDGFDGLNTIYVHGDYAMDAIGVGANVEAMMFATSDFGTKLKIDPFASYTIGNTKIGGDFIYQMATKAGDPGNFYAEKSSIEVKPYVTFTLGKGTLKMCLDYLGKDLAGTDPTTKFFVDYVFNF